MNTDPVVSWNVVLVLGLLLNLAVAVVTLARANRVQKREVSFSDNYATRPEVDTIRSELTTLEQKLDKSLEAIRVELKADRIALTREDEERASKLHHRIDDVLRAVSRLEGKICKTLS